MTISYSSPASLQVKCDTCMSYLTVANTTDVKSAVIEQKFIRTTTIDEPYPRHVCTTCIQNGRHKFNQQTTYSEEDSKIILGVMEDILSASGNKDPKPVEDLAPLANTLIDNLEDANFDDDDEKPSIITDYVPPGSEVVLTGQFARGVRVDVEFELRKYDFITSKRVTKNTKVVVVGDKSNHPFTSAKTKDAKKLSVPVVSEETFFRQPGISAEIAQAKEQRKLAEREKKLRAERDALIRAEVEEQKKNLSQVLQESFDEEDLFSI